MPTKIHQNPICWIKETPGPTIGLHASPMAYGVQVFNCSFAKIHPIDNHSRNKKRFGLWGCLTSIYWQHILCKSQAIHRSFQVKVSLGILEVGIGLGPVEDTPRGLQEGASQLRTKRGRCKTKARWTNTKKCTEFFFRKWMLATSPGFNE